MVKVNAQIRGDKQLERALRQLPKATAKSVLRSALKRAAKPTEDKARQYAPVGPTGNLKASITIKTVLKKSQRPAMKQGAVQMYVGATTPKGAHAHLIEFGTRKMAPQPFMRPAWDRTKSKVAATLGDEIWKSIVKSARTLANKAEKGTLSKSAYRALSRK